MFDAQVVPLVSDKKLSDIIRAHARAHGGLQSVEIIRATFSDLSDSCFNNEHARKDPNEFPILDETQMALAALVLRLRRLYDCR